MWQATVSHVLPRCAQAHRFAKDVILLTLRREFRLPLSYRDARDLLAERGCRTMRHNASRSTAGFWIGIAEVFYDKVVEELDQCPLP
ncbi:hypothetical protein [uncultured Roseobacter sp.]|uniref:hypothetical protein n=1 Tax=uncultured Roseobacter sp. TaxID=114847 RepID=UPI0026062B02|nr:hypothetical protein [uncultured Roseobacter sp.]